MNVPAKRVVATKLIALGHVGFMKACIACPASFVCMTELVQEIYYEGEIRVFRRLKGWLNTGHIESLYLGIRGEPLAHCPAGKKKIV